MKKIVLIGLVLSSYATLHASSWLSTWETVKNSPAKVSKYVVHSARSMSPAVQAAKLKAREEWFKCELSREALEACVKQHTDDKTFFDDTELKGQLINAYDELGRTQIHRLVDREGVNITLDTVKCLQELGADLNMEQKSTQGWMPFTSIGIDEQEVGYTLISMLAEQGMSIEGLTELAELGAQPAHVNQFGQTLLHILASSNKRPIDKEFIDWCFKYDVPFKQQDTDGNTFLHICCERLTLAELEKLENFGPFDLVDNSYDEDTGSFLFDVNVKNKKGDTILDILKRKGLKEEHPLYQLIIDAGDDREVVEPPVQGADDNPAPADYFSFQPIPPPPPEVYDNLLRVPSPRLPIPAAPLLAPFRDNVDAEAPGVPQPQKPQDAKQSYMTGKNAFIVTLIVCGVASAVFYYMNKYKNKDIKRPAADTKQQVEISVQ